MSKNIVCGEIETDKQFLDTPINVFKKAVELSKKDNFCVKTNNPQLVETLEVLCGEENINFYICINEVYNKQYHVRDVYHYLGDVYKCINSLRFQMDFDDEITDKDIQQVIDEYNLKHDYCSEQPVQIIEENFKEYVEILEPKHIQAYQTDKPVVYSDNWGHKRIARSGDWIIKHQEGSITSSSSLGKYEEILK